MRLEMGFLDRLANFLGLRKAECSVIVVGLDNSGKSTLLNHFKPEEDKHADIVPTVGFNVEKFKSKTTNLFLFSFVFNFYQLYLFFGWSSFWCWNRSLADATVIFSLGQMQSEKKNIFSGLKNNRLQHY